MAQQSTRENDVSSPTVYWLQLTEGQMIDLASRYCPNAVKALCLRDLDQHREDERRAARPVKPVKTRA